MNFPPVLETRARDLSKSYYGQKVEDVGAPLWSEINKKQKTGRRLGQPLKNSEIRPLEFLTPPKALDGSSGTNRGDRRLRLKRHTDIEATSLWLKAKGTNANTQAAYRREAERFLLWCLLEKRLALSSARLEECSEYLKWLEMMRERKRPKTGRNPGYILRKLGSDRRIRPENHRIGNLLTLRLPTRAGRPPQQSFGSSFRSFIRPVI